MAECIFCKIVRGEVPSAVVHRSERVTAFRDTNPQAPVHILVIPNTHISSLKDVSAEHYDVLGEMVGVANRLAQSEGIDGTGYRVVVNTGPNAGQTVFHLHAHLLGGRHFTWPPG